MYSFAAGAHNVFADILDELKKLNSSQSNLQQQLLCFRRDLSDMKAVMSILQKSPDVEILGSAPLAIDLQPPRFVDSRWSCPICHKGLAHKESFRGHIRKLVYSSTRPKCHLNPADERHATLVARFPGATFYERAKAFCTEFYTQVSWSCTKRDDDDQSFEHVKAWIGAALSDVERDFPVYDPRYRASARKQRQEGDAYTSPEFNSEKTTSQSSFDSFFSDAF